MYVYTNLKSGSYGDQVLALQRNLPSWCLPADFTFDGHFGSKTKSAVMNYQEAMNFTVDGIAGKTTASSLNLWVEIEKGFDASHYQIINWDKLDSSLKFGIFKATEGKTYTDPNFFESVSASKNKGLDTGAYHFTKFANSPFAEFENFYTQCSKAGKLDFVFLDLEHRQYTGDIESWVSTFLDLCSTFFETDSIGVYTSSNFLREKGLQNFQKLADYNLWGCDLNSQPIVYPWTGWQFWQYTFNGLVDGIEGFVDLDYRVVKEPSNVLPQQNHRKSGQTSNT